MAKFGFKNCDAVGCTETTKIHLTMCRTHWHLVPAELRKRIAKTFRAWRAGASAGWHLIAALEAKLAVAKAEDADPAVRISLALAINEFEARNTELDWLAHLLAEEHARSLIDCHSVSEDADGREWIDVTQTALSGVPLAEMCEQEFRYLELRNKFERHPQRPNLVRILED